MRGGLWSRLSSANPVAAPSRQASPPLQSGKLRSLSMLSVGGRGNDRAQCQRRARGKPDRGEIEPVIGERTAQRTRHHRRPQQQIRPPPPAPPPPHPLPAHLA